MKSVVQPMFQFESDPALPRVRSVLRRTLGELPEGLHLAPMDQLVRSELGGQTYDEVSFAAFERLKARFPDWSEAARAEPAEIEALIADVKHADAKAAWLVQALRTIIAWRGDASLDFLSDLPLETAFRKLKNLMGVGSKVASAVLNFSTFARPMLVVDSHVARVTYRLGLVSSASNLDRAHLELMRMIDAAWDAEDLYELHRLIKRFGQETCKTIQPGCHDCPFASDCPSVWTTH